MRTTSQDYYEVLGVDRNADHVAIRAAYRSLARKHHPDVDPGNTESRDIYRVVSQAWDVLGDPAKRREYDYNYFGISEPGWIKTPTATYSPRHLDRNGSSLSLFMWRGVLRGVLSSGYVYAEDLSDARHQCGVHGVTFGSPESHVIQIDKFGRRYSDPWEFGCLVGLLLLPFNLTSLGRNLIMYPAGWILSRAFGRTGPNLNPKLILPPNHGHFEVLEPAASRSTKGSAGDMSQWHPLFRAAAQGDVTIVYEQIAGGVHVNTEDTAGFTALHFAAMNNRPEVLKLLLSIGADVHKKTDDGFTALDLAVENRARVAESLLRSASTR